ncbi:AfsR/SARP family transcriptional regulator [Streptomyces sp. MK7]|uniref:AfsR/SARP family transcriptional regulator n=1 Tax=Streptomyces sp. MK7 TaxID=3067635 RepID=UPI0029310BAD|nr:AfsR/SARP family transcriptional regulator [Streptomyces sp. MK7]
MDSDIFGALAVRENGVSITPTAPKPRQVLALLVLHADRFVPADTLVEELWGQHPPCSARPTLQTYVLQLRELITAALRLDPPGAPPRTAKDVLLTLPGGYLLKADGGVHAAQEFQRLIGMGHRAMDAEDHIAAEKLLSEALSLWTGPPLPEITPGEHLGRVITKLEEDRLCALDRRVDVDLRLGRHRELLGELSVLVSRYPQHESLCGQYMLALHRSGRRSEALDAYRRLRDTLVGTLGIEPSLDLAKLQQAILRAGTAVAAPPRPHRADSRVRLQPDSRRASHP